MRKLITLVLLWLLGMIHVDHATAQVAATIRQNNVSVKSEPNPRSQTLTVLRTGTRVLVTGRNGNWLLVKLKQSGFEFSGWVERSAFTATAQRPAPRPTPSPSSPTVDQFFESSPRSTSPSSSNSRPSSFDSPRTNDGFVGEWLEDKLKLSGGLGFSFLTHKAAGTAVGETNIKYNLSGLSFDLLAQYEFWKSQSKKLRAGAELGYEYAFFFSKTDLRDANGNSFDTRNSNNAANDLNIRGTLSYQLSQTLSAGTLLGFRYFSFSGDDIVDNSGNPLNLYVSSSLITFPLGLFGTYTGKSFEGTLGVNLLLLNSYSEDPEGASGTDPSAGIGFNPYMKLDYAFAPKHYVGLFYELMSQKVTFNGTGTRTTFTVTNAEIKNTVHNIGFSYQYRF